MPDRPMAFVVSATNDIHAQIIGARLGAEGILWELRPSVGAPYSVGAVAVMVEADRLDEARELLLADDVEAVFDDEDEALLPRAAASPWLFAVALGLLVVFVALRIMSLG